MAQSTQMTPAQQAANVQAQNLAIRNAIIRGGFGQPPAVNMWQALNPPVPANAGPGTVLTIQLRNVGLVKRLLVHMTVRITGAVGFASNLTPLGLANLVSNFTFTDLANNQRINTAGWHLVLLSSVKRRRVWGSAAVTDTPFGYGSNFTTNRAPAVIAASPAFMDLDVYYEVPFAYNDHDLTGCIFADVTQATMQLQITINNGALVAITDDPTLAVYQSAGAALPTMSLVTCQIYQNYLDQLPVDMRSGVPYLPALDLGTAYMLNNTTSPQLIANQDNAIPFVNARKFQSVSFIYDNNGALNPGTDINSIAITSANFTNITKLDPKTQSLMTRIALGDDLPLGTYNLDFRDRPIDTNQYGNMQLIVNPSVAGVVAVLLLGWEAFGIIGLVNQGGAIPSG